MKDITMKDIAKKIVEALGVEEVDELLHDIYIYGSEYFTGQLRQALISLDSIEDYCPDCKVYCIKRYIDGRCE